MSRQSGPSNEGGISKSKSPASRRAGAEGGVPYGPGLAELRVSPLAGHAPDALLRQLGPAPVEAGGVNLVELLAPAYEALAQAAERRALEG